MTRQYASAAAAADTEKAAHETADLIEAAALAVFYAKGYHGASIRAIASKANVGLSTLFHHYPNKAAILERILHRAVDAMQDDIDAAVDGAEDPVERLSAAVRALVVAHCERQSQSFVAQSELRSLELPAEEEIRRKRRLVQAVYDDAVRDGVEAGLFTCPYPHEAARAIVSMGTMVATWYHAGRGLSPQKVSDIYVDMALRIVGADPSARLSSTS
jgi:AcrR family transcriptional regulator